MCWPANSHCVPLKSSVLFNTEYLAIFNFPDLLYFLMPVPVVCMLFQQLYKSCVLNGNPPSFTHCIFSPLRDFVDSRFNHLKRNLSLSYRTSGFTLFSVYLYGESLQGRSVTIVYHRFRTWYLVLCQRLVMESNLIR